MARGACRFARDSLRCATASEAHTYTVALGGQESIHYWRLMSTRARLDRALVTARCCARLCRLTCARAHTRALARLDSINGAAELYCGAQLSHGSPSSTTSNVVGCVCACV